MSAPSEQPPSLIWGVLSFIPPEDPSDEAELDLDEPAESTFDIEAIDGTNRGNPVAIVETLPSLFLEGSLAAVTGWENREILIGLRISANDGDALSEAEAALFQQVLLDQPPPLQWTSPVGGSATSVYDTVVATLEEDTEGWDQNEILYGERYYTLKLTCLPFARAVESIIVPALPVPEDPETPVTVQVDDGSDVTPGGAHAGTWTLESNGTSPTGPTVDATRFGDDAIMAGALLIEGSEYIRLVRHFGTPLAVPSGNYLVVDVGVASGGSGPVGEWKIHDGVKYRTPVAVAYGAGEGFSIRLYFEDLPASMTDLKVLFDFSGPSPNVSMWVVNLAYSDTLELGPMSTARQQSRLTTVYGSAPTQAALRVYDDTPADLGTDILVYTSRNTDWTPNLRQYLDSSETVNDDPATVSGHWHFLFDDEDSAPSVYVIPAELIAQGSYALLGRLICDAATLSWQARMVTSGGAAMVGSSVITSGSVELTETDVSEYEVFDLGAMILPVVEVEGSNHAVELTLTVAGGFAQVDELWLFSLDDGVLTWLRDDEGMDWVDVRSPELGAARPSVWGGRNALLNNPSCVDWKCRSFGAHRFYPGVMQVFTVTPESLVSQCELEYFPRFFGNVRGSEDS